MTMFPPLLAIATALTGLLFIGSIRRANLSRCAQEILAMFMLGAAVGPLFLYWRIAISPNSGGHSVLDVIHIFFFGLLLTLPVVFLGGSVALTLLDTKKRNLIIILSFVIIVIFGESYFGHRCGTEWSPDKRYRVEYYEIFPYLIPIIPGDHGRSNWGWVRLYDACNHKLHEKFSHRFSSLTMDGGRWLDDELIYLGEDEISWPLPTGECQS